MVNKKWLLIKHNVILLKTENIANIFLFILFIKEITKTYIIIDKTDYIYYQILLLVIWITYNIILFKRNNNYKKGKKIIYFTIHNFMFGH